MHEPPSLQPAKAPTASLSDSHDAPGAAEVVPDIAPLRALIGSMGGAPSTPPDGESPPPRGAFAGRAATARMVTQLQRVRGNVYVQRLLSEAVAIQRQKPAPAPPAAVPDASGAPAAVETWKVPGGMVPDFIALDPGPITEKAVAGQVLFLVTSRMEELKEVLEPAEFTPVQTAINAVDVLRKRLLVEGALEHGDVIDLNIIVPGAKSAFDRALGGLRDSISQALSSLAKDFSGADTSVAEHQLSEKLHLEFIHGATPESLEKAKKALATVKEYKERLDSVAEWAGRLAKLAKAAKVTEFIENFGKKSKAVGDVLGKLGTVLDVAELLASLTSGHGGQTGPQASIKEARAGLKVLDVTVGVAGKIFPLFGTLWSSYYSPMTKACLDAAQRLFDIQDYGERHYTMMAWWQMHDPPTLPPPTTPDNIKLRNLFPGGQAVLTFMYNLVNGGGANVNSEVEAFFVSRKDLFNAGEEDKNKLKSESQSHWYNPLSWGAKETSPNLVSWVTRNADTVWAQLYGSLPHSLRTGG